MTDKPITIKLANKNYILNKYVNIQNKTYRLDKLLGQGSYGAVFKGTHLATGEIFAIKVIQNDTATIKKETHLIDDLRCDLTDIQGVDFKQFVPCFYDSGSEEDLYYIVTKFIKGKSLKDFILEDILTKSTAEANVIREKLIDELINKLGELHKIGIFHQDIKDENIMIEEGTHKPVYVDFGLSCRLDDSECPKRGTPYFLPPEILMDVGGKGPIAKKAHDIWSLGITILHMYLLRRQKNTEYKIIDTVLNNFIDIQLPKIVNNILKKNNIDKKSPKLFNFLNTDQDYLNLSEKLFKSSEIPENFKQTLRILLKMNYMDRVFTFEKITHTTKAFMPQDKLSISALYKLAQDKGIDCAKITVNQVYQQL